MCAGVNTLFVRNAMNIIKNVIEMKKFVNIKQLVIIKLIMMIMANERTNFLYTMCSTIKV